MNRIALVTLPTILILWSAAVYAGITPNNRLHDQGLGNLVCLVLTVGTFSAICLGIVGIFARKKTPTPLFIANQILCWGYMILPLLVLAGAFAAARAGF